MARMVDGDFDFVGNAIRVRNAPPRTIAILNVLQGALVDARKGTPPQQVIAKIEKASPELASAISKKIAKSGPLALAGLLLALLANCSMNTSATLNWNQLIDQVHVYGTGSEPYPISEPNEASPPGAGGRSKLSRQQRRHIERQAKKQQQQIERQRRKKPNS